ncbi:MAG: hypothetical protein IID36_10035 [Planctomycetes bacterium]|nr:hypothetical protein [Planctomycetota bacterium]
MSLRRALGAHALAAIVFGLSGCNSLTTSPDVDTNEDAIPDSEDGFTTSLAGFDDARELLVRADGVTYETASVSIPTDLVSGAMDEAYVSLSAEQVSASVDDGRFRGKSKHGSRGKHYAELTVFLGRMADPTCDPDAEIGTFEIVIDDQGITVQPEFLPLGVAARKIARAGDFRLCAETSGDFDGAISVTEFKFDFGHMGGKKDRVEICHKGRTIMVSVAALHAHEKHGDTPGKCAADGDDPEEGETEPLDTDGDGVTDEADDCANTPTDDDVYENGCTIIVIDADAGPDVAATQGDVVTVVGSASVLAGDYEESELVFTWAQVAGPPADYESASPPLTVDTSGVAGVLVFELTVSTADGAAFATDQFSLTVVEANPKIVGLFSGMWHNGVVLDDGRLVLWGSNKSQQLGDGSITTDVAHADAAVEATLVALTDGTVWTWGKTPFAWKSPVPIQVEPIDDAVMVAAMSMGGLVLRSDGSVWGYTADNSNCDLGGNAASDAFLEAVPIDGLPGNIEKVAAGDHHAVALDSDGNAWVWGGDFGCAPWIAMTGVADAAAGALGHVLFVTNDGTAWAMGLNDRGQLGDGTTISNFTEPGEVVGLSNVATVAAGQRHSLFISTDGSLWACGWNRYCQLGLEGEVSPESPVFGDIVTPPQPVAAGAFKSAAGSQFHSVAVDLDDRVWVWGGNALGQLEPAGQDLPDEVCTPVEAAVDIDE